MIVLACLNCHLLVMLLRSSPSCPNCQYVHSLPLITHQPPPPSQHHHPPLPRVPPNTIPYSTPTSGAYAVAPQRPPGIVLPSIRPLQPPLSLPSGQQPIMVNRPHPMPLFMSVPNIPPPPPGSQFTPMPIPHQFMPPSISMMPPPPPLSHGMPPPPPPFPDEPEPKRQRLDDSMLIPEDQFLAQHPGPVCITISVPNVDEGNLKGQVLNITVQSLSETVGSLKEKIAGEIQIPANKQRLSGKAGFLKDNMTLAYYNVGAEEMLPLSLRERGGRKRRRDLDIAV